MKSTIIAVVSVLAFFQSAIATTGQCRNSQGQLVDASDAYVNFVVGPSYNPGVCSEMLTSDNYVDFNPLDNCGQISRIYMEPRDIDSLKAYVQSKDGQRYLMFFDLIETDGKTYTKCGIVEEEILVNDSTTTCTYDTLCAVQTNIPPAQCSDDDQTFLQVSFQRWDKSGGYNCTEKPCNSYFEWSNTPCSDIVNNTETCDGVAASIYYSALEQWIHHSTSSSSTRELVFAYNVHCELDDSTTGTVSVRSYSDSTNACETVTTPCEVQFDACQFVYCSTTGYTWTAPEILTMLGDDGSSSTA